MSKHPIFDVAFRRRDLAAAAALTAAIVLLDQMTKAWARAWLTSPLEIAPVLNLRLGFNPGVSFGLFAGDGETSRWILVAATGAVAAAMLVGMARTRRPSVKTALALIAGGAIGNIIDRVQQGAVTDFIDVHLGGAHWPTFNLADAAIFLGVAALIVFSARMSPGERSIAVRSAP